MEEPNDKSTVEKSSKSDNIWFVITTIIAIIAICFSATLLFQKRYFDRFFVNGQSMFPTLNEKAGYEDRLYGKYYEPLTNGSHHIDYGIYDRHEQAIKSIKRFDIVICKYDSSDTYEKIKRVIAMPGETFKIVSGGENNGDLYIMNPQTNEFDSDPVEQPVVLENIREGSYPKIYSEAYTLGKDEYFVMGDNRAHSSDSRTTGPVKKEYIDGKVVAIVAHCTIGFNSSGNIIPDKIDYYPPRYL